VIDKTGTGFRGRLVVVLVFVFLGLLLTSCRSSVHSEDDQEVSSLGSVEVTARLLEIPGQFPPNDLYNYAYVLKY
jgi:hypothetical protein